MIEKIITLAKRPSLFLESTAPFWNDEHISEQMLNAHLEPEDDKASRKHSTIDLSVAWIKKEFIRDRSCSILDLGCGPGLYCQRLSDKSVRVTGIDISGRSITYAIRQGEKAHLLIDYHQKDYLTINYEAEFDIILLIYCDFSVLPPSKQQILLSKIYRALKPGGVFIFDVFTINYEKYHKERNNWHSEVTGFWKNEPYIDLHNQFHYPSSRVFVDQHIIIYHNDKVDVYRLWDQYYNEVQIIEILSKQPFQHINIYGDVTGREYSDNSDVMCITCTK